MKSIWQRIPGLKISPFLPLVKKFCPELVRKTDDLWQFKEVLFRLAVLRDRKYINRIQIAYHFIWDTPRREQIRKRHPQWSQWLVDQRFSDFRSHVDLWGPGDVELVVLDLIRSPSSGATNLISLESKEFRPMKINYRHAAHFWGIFNQISRWQWDKLGQKRINVNFTNQSWQEAGKKIILVNDSYHHSFFSPEELSKPELIKKLRYWPNPIKPKIRYFSPQLWEAYKVSEKDRGFESWEII